MQNVGRGHANQSYQTDTKGGKVLSFLNCKKPIMTRSRVSLV